MGNGVDRRAQIDGETAKALLLINGGGAIALVSIFTAIVDKPGYGPIVSAILIAVFGMMMGLILAVLHNHYRRQCSLHYEQHSMRPPAGTLWGCQLSQPRVCWIASRLMWASLLTFGMAGCFVAYTGVVNIHRTEGAPAEPIQLDMRVLPKLAR